MPEVGRVVQIDEAFGTVESVKTVSDLYAPVGGEVIETNATLGAQSELVNTDPYSGGWMVKVRISNPSEVEELLDAADYEKSLS